MQYPLIVVELAVNGLPPTVEAALSDTLPTAVLFGRDLPELSQLIGGHTATEPTRGSGENCSRNFRRKVEEKSGGEKETELQVQEDAEDKAEGP